MKNSEGRRNSQEPKLRNQARKETLARSKEEEERNVSRYLGIKEPSATGGLDCFIDEGAFRAVAVCGAEVGTRWRRGRARARGRRLRVRLQPSFGPRCAMNGIISGRVPPHSAEERDDNGR